MPTPKKTAVAKKAAVAKKTTDEKSTELAEQWLELARTGEQTVIETLREFVETVEKAGGSLAKQREIIDSGVEMAQVIIRAQYDALRGLVSSAVLVNVAVDTNIDTDVGVEVPTNVDTNIDTDVGVEVPTDVDVASKRESTT